MDRRPPLTLPVTLYCTEETGHTGVDVPTTADGWWSDLLAGSYPNTRLFEAMHSAIQWWLWLPIVVKELVEARPEASRIGA